jgi:transcription elongation factor GreA-like protein
MAREMRNVGKRAQAATLLSLMVEHYERSGTPAQRVELLSFIAGAQEKERTWRGQLAKALQDLHAERPGFEIFLEACGLTGDASVDAALESLEKMLRFDIGSYALHASGWGVGHVDGVDVIARELTIVFEGGRRHSMPVQSAVETLTPLPTDDWRVLRHFKVEELRELCARDPGEVIARILRQFGRPVDVATLRLQLQGAVIPPSQWSRFWSGARKAALHRPDVEMQGNKLIWRKVGRTELRTEPQEADMEILICSLVQQVAYHIMRNPEDMGPYEHQEFGDTFVGTLGEKSDGYQTLRVARHQVRT